MISKTRAGCASDCKVHLDTVAMSLRPPQHAVAAMIWQQVIAQAVPLAAAQGHASVEVLPEDPLAVGRRRREGRWVDEPPLRQVVVNVCSLRWQTSCLNALTLEGAEVCALTSELQGTQQCLMIPFAAMCHAPALQWRRSWRRSSRHGIG